MIRTSLCVAAMVAAAAPALAQAPAAPAATVFMSPTEITALAARAKAEHKPGEANTVLPLAKLDPYTANLEYRTADAPPAVHEKDAEFFVVLDGAGTAIVGGKLIGEQRRNATNLGGTGIDGGTVRAVAKGDVIFVPEGAPHQFVKIQGLALVLMSMHVPRPTAWTR